ncbi:MAG: sarcosine oxidase subunit gamma [Burkholderiaceae bacterium]|nr:sarcosine oxidase subunit gamma [Microbacteriaceae bacterium]
MVESTTARSPLEGWTDRFAAVLPDIRLEELTFTPMVNLRVGAGARAAVEAAIGAALPTGPALVGSCRAGTLVWLAPDEFLLLSDRAGDTAQALCALLDGALAGDGAAVDVSAQRTIVSLGGPCARDLLAGGCSADLDAAVAPTGTSVQTLLAQTGIVIIVADAGSGEFLLVVRSSFATYLASWLLQGAREYA